ncbi:MAG: ABC transporter ATP-binding protein [Clostridiales bacterium]|nr:ABC transporter ATP-binding protein [Clostridiales bacterium]
MSLLSLKDVCLTYFSADGETQALNNINIDINDGEFVSIVGPSGCGKTTILHLISNLLSPTKGEIKLNIPADKSFIGYMFQKDNLLEWRTIANNVYLGLELQGKKNKENMEYADSLLKKYNLWEFRNKHPRELSGGMRQRVALIRTLALKPSILLLDEAFSALDYQTRLSVCDDVYDIIKKEKLTTILVTHDLSEAISLSDRIIILSHRPAEVKHVITLSFDKENTPLQKRQSPLAKKYFDIIWEDLK